MLIDDFLPTYSVAERHAIDVQASPDVVYRAIRSADLARALPVRLLFALRALPAALIEGRAGLARLARRGRSPITLDQFERHGFVVLAENPPRELLIGLVGAFWTLRGGLRATDATRFRGPQRAGTARAAWNFVVDARDERNARLSTETRVEPVDAASARRFRAYWLLVRPWSGLTRRCMLRAIRHEAERQARAASC
jgi:hypothetical protein